MITLINPNKKLYLTLKWLANNTEAKSTRGLDAISIKKFEFMATNGYAAVRAKVDFPAEYFEIEPGLYLPTKITKNLIILTPYEGINRFDMVETFFDSVRNIEYPGLFCLNPDLLKSVIDGFDKVIFNPHGDNVALSMALETDKMIE